MNDTKEKSNPILLPTSFKNIFIWSYKTLFINLKYILFSFLYYKTAVLGLIFFLFNCFYIKILLYNFDNLLAISLISTFLLTVWSFFLYKYFIAFSYMLIK